MAKTRRQAATEILNQAAKGDRDSAAQLLPLVYEQLHARAEAYLRRENPGHTLQATALVHDAYSRLVDQSRVDWQGRTHFVAVAAQEMRRILVDHARARRAQKRGGGWNRVTLSEAVAEDGNAVDILDLDEALTELALLDPRLAKVIELRFFAGSSVKEVGEQLGIALSTVEKDWRLARAWLRNRLS